MDAATEGFLDGTEALSVRLADAAEHEVVVRRMSESIQSDPGVLAAMDAAGVRPGVPVRASLRGALVLVGDGECRLPGVLAEHIFVAR